MSDEYPILMRYKARGLSPKHWSQADGFALPLVGIILFGALTWAGFAYTSLWILLPSIPILVTCIILLGGDIYLMWYEKYLDRK